MALTFNHQTNEISNDGVITVGGVAVGGDNSPVYWYGSRGVFGGGNSNVMDYITIQSTGNATDFGDLAGYPSYPASFSNGTRGIFCGTDNDDDNRISYITIAITGDSTDFGDLSVARNYAQAGCSNGVRGVIGGGVDSGFNPVNIIDYITIATTGNATDFGDLSSERSRMGAVSDGLSNSDRGVFIGGYQSSRSNVIDYVTVSTTGNATDFGDLTVATSNFQATASDIRGVAGGGTTGSYVNTIEYITIATTGNATDFGDLTLARVDLAACSDLSRGCFGGGRPSGNTDTIDYITINTTGNATDFGDLTTARKALGACSGT